MKYTRNYLLIPILQYNIFYYIPLLPKLDKNSLKYFNYALIRFVPCFYCIGAQQLFTFI